VPQIEVHNILHCTVLTSITNPSTQYIALYCAYKYYKSKYTIYCTVLCLQIHKSIKPR